MILLPRTGLGSASFLAWSICAALASTQYTENKYEDKASSGKVVVFGDSLSDNGTGAWRVSNNTWPSDEAYYGHRFTNGPVWVEYLAELLGMELDDNAVGGATSDNKAVQGYTGLHSTIPVPSVLDQVAAYLKRSKIGPEDLIVIMIGANDAFFKLTVDNVIPAISNMIYTLHNNGAKRFIVASYPNLGRLPLRAFSSNSTSSTLERLSLTIERSLLTLRYQICLETDIQVGFVDIYALFRDMMLTPIDYGLDPNTITKSCLVGAYEEAPRTLCDDPDKYIFWDEYHPTRIVHKYMGAMAWKASQVLCNN